MDIDSLTMQDLDVPLYTARSSNSQKIADVRQSVQQSDEKGNKACQDERYEGIVESQETSDHNMNTNQSQEFSTDQYVYFDY